MDAAHVTEDLLRLIVLDVAVAAIRLYTQIRCLLAHLPTGCRYNRVVVATLNRMMACTRPDGQQPNGERGALSRDGGRAPGRAEQSKQRGSGAMGAKRRASKVIGQTRKRGHLRQKAL